MGNLVLNGSSSGQITLSPPSAAGTNTLTLPAVTDTLVTLAATQTLTNKTLTSPTMTSPTMSGAVVSAMASSVITSGTVNAGGTNPFPSTAGPTSVDFTSIPTWVKRITVMFSGVSTSGTSNIQIQIGSGSVTTSGYVSAAGYAGSTNAAGSGTITSGHVIDGLNSTAAWVRYGSCRIENITGNAWVFSHSLGLLSSGAPYFIGGGGISPALSGALDRIRITTVSGTDLFDAGSINILYE